MAGDTTITFHSVSRREFFALGMLGVAAAALGGCGSSQNTPGTAARAAAAKIPDGEPVAQVAARVGPSVVQVNVEAIQTDPFGNRGQGQSPFAPQSQDWPDDTRGPQGVGSGVIYREDGYLITNNHVVDGVAEVNVAFADGSTERGEIIGADAFTDIAVVGVGRDNLPAASFGESAGLKVGQLAVAIGSPSGFQSTVTSGVISGLGREVSAQYTGGRQEDALVDLIQTDAAVSPGSSGGALANRAGEVIGINVAYLPAETGAESIAFAIPSDTAASVADQLIANGRAVHPYLGVSLVDLTPETSKQFGGRLVSGAVVMKIDPDGPAARAGIHPGDVITAIGSAEVEDSGDLLGELRSYQPGDTVELTVDRNGQQRRVPVNLAERGSRA